MDYEYSQTPLSKSVMAGLAAGITATLLNLVYNFIVRGITKLSLSVSVINVSTIIFATVVVCIIGGLIYYFIVLYLKQRVTVFTALFIVITVVAVILGLSFRISAQKDIARQFDGLYVGMVIITGVCTTFLVPWLARHRNAFFD